MKIYIETLGCKVNTYESEIIKEEFLRNGYEEAKDVKMAAVSYTHLTLPTTIGV